MDVQRRYVIAKFEIRVDTIENNLELDIVIGENFFRFNNLRLGYCTFENSKLYPISSTGCTFCEKLDRISTDLEY